MMGRFSVISFFAFCFLLISLAACSKKSYLERSNEETALRDALRKLTKDPSDEEAADAVPVLYKNIKTTHTARIKSYSSSAGPEKWDLIIGEYGQLQQLYNQIIGNGAAIRLVKPDNYSSHLLEAKDSAASAYYRLGSEALNKNGRANCKRAYNYFKKSETYVEGFKDAESKAIEAFNRAMVNVAVNPIKDFTGYFNSVGGSISGVNHNDVFRKNLLRDLGGKSNSGAPARFFTEEEMKRDSVKIDWVVAISLKTLDLPGPANTAYTRQVSNRIQIGTDTSGNAVFQTVNATLNIVRSKITSRAEMNMLIKDVNTQIDVDASDFSEEYKWEQESATFTGDKRALSSGDWDLINNSGNVFPGKDFRIDQLYKKLLPQMRIRISNAANW